MRIFIDDERLPPDDGNNWIIKRNLQEVDELLDEIVDWGSVNKISFISFDHDLGEYESTGYDIVKWIVECDIQCNILSSDFTFYVHSQNPVGKANIEGYLNQYLKQIKGA